MIKFISKYRFIDGKLSNRQSEEMQFFSIREMCDFIISDWKDNVNGILLITYNDIIIGKNLGEHLGWKEQREVRINQLEIDGCKIPSCIGYCSIEDRVEWISCKDKLPDPNDDDRVVKYLVTVEHPNPSIKRKILCLGYGNKGDSESSIWFYPDGGICEYPVLYWMQYPEPCWD